MRTRLISAKLIARRPKYMAKRKDAWRRIFIILLTVRNWKLPTHLTTGNGLKNS